MKWLINGLEILSHPNGGTTFGKSSSKRFSQTFVNSSRLNEGFASWVETLGLNNSNPEFQALNVFVTCKSLLDPSDCAELLLLLLLATVQRALVMDSLFSSHPISVEVTHPDEINSIFDAISCKSHVSLSFVFILSVVCQMTKAPRFSG